jgi:hypothetical protein
MATTAAVYVQDHSFLLGDRAAATPFEAMDYSTGLVGLMPSAAMIYAGVDRGIVTVTVTVDAVGTGPALHTPQQWAATAEWEDIAEVSLYVPNGELRVDRLEYGPAGRRVDLPTLSPHGPRHYRIRIHARGRDRHYDQIVDDSGESYHLVSWPQPPSPPLIIKATSICGYGLRLAHLQQPTPTAAHQETRELDDAARQEILRRGLG